ncbi:MAG TPA: ABATE domain-containing protein [Gemmatimonadales bacterium]|jgi:predicted RNA-binding Zn ribbon-like protein|nr:ABATE domain-containing protein [Gemmatimonadales bacterium]
MMSTRHPSPFVFVGNHRALDFVNTQVATEGVLRDLLGDFADLVQWLEATGSIDRPSARKALVQWKGKRSGAAALTEARALRAALRRLADAAGAGRQVPRATLERVNQLLGRGAAVTRLAPGSSGFVAQRGLLLTEPLDLLVPIAEAAADLLCHADLSRVRRCAHSACVLYFLDGTKNGTRRWCDMRTCGNRANAAAYYLRQRSAE